MSRYTEIDSYETRVRDFVRLGHDGLGQVQYAFTNFAGLILQSTTNLISAWKSDRIINP
jgi:hypothetical protein